MSRPDPRDPSTWEDVEDEYPDPHDEYPEGGEDDE